MREIKFRAWDTIDNQFINIDNMPIKELQNLFRTKVMQFTGLQDKNGVDIYEGDIVNCIPVEEYVDCYHMIGIREVVYNVNSASFNYSNSIPMDWGGIEYYEVVGNIYENKVNDYDTEY